MSRSARKFSESGIYHVMFRGSNKQSIFLDNRDYAKFMELLQKVKEKKEFELYAYCLMTNHVHLVLKEKNVKDISEIMKRILCEYVVWFNLKYERSGILMENRYRSQPVEDDEYFLHVVRYVHQNPLKAGMVGKLDEYPWSSYCDYIGDDASVTDKSFLAEMMSRSQFVEFHKEEEAEEFELFSNPKLMTDEELVEAIRKFGIENPSDLQYVKPEELSKILNSLKKKFSVRHISRVTGINRAKL